MKTMTPEAARAYAAEAHGDQLYGTAPYVTHLDAVASLVREFNLGPLYEVAAYLHDVLEDTPRTATDLEAAGVQPWCVQAVEAVTGRGPNRKARNADAYRKLKAWPEAIDLKLCDRLANGRASAGVPDKLAMYRREYPAFRVELKPYGGSYALWGALDALFLVE